MTAAEWRAKAQFAEVEVREDSAAPSLASDIPTQITVSGLVTEITLPRDYPVANLVQIIRALEACSAGFDS